MKKLLNNEIFLYLVFGVLATIVYFFARFSALHLGASNMLAMIIAQVTAIVFAFFTNRTFVFKAQDLEKSAFLQFIQFVAARLSGIAIDFLITLLCIEIGQEFFIALFRLDKIDYSQGIFALTPFSNFIGSPILANTFIWTMVIQVIIIVANYLFSKFLIFKKA